MVGALWILRRYRSVLTLVTTLARVFARADMLYGYIKTQEILERERIEREAEERRQREEAGAVVV